jgi:hypothetical protein
MPMQNRNTGRKEYRRRRKRISEITRSVYHARITNEGTFSAFPLHFFLASFLPAFLLCIGIAFFLASYWG